MSVIYEITEDPYLLGQYYKIRENAYRSELGLDSFDGSEEQADRDNHVLIARIGDVCVGGARITNIHIGTEQGKQYFRPLALQGLKTAALCVWERLALTSTMRREKLQPEFLQHLINVSWAWGYHFAFTVSSLRNARFYRRCHSALNVRYQICRGVQFAPLSEFAHLDQVLSVAHLRSLSAANVLPYQNHHSLPVGAVGIAA